MHFSTAYEWLSWIASIHPRDIALGLDRVKPVAQRLGVLKSTSVQIVVGGTNGKGSTVAGLEAIYRAQGYRVGAYTSPLLFKHNEQVRIDGENACDEAFCAAFASVEAARGDTSLTPFEFFTLAALVIFKQHTLDVMILEVGLGGRLDAVNIVDADAAVITSIAIDHVEWLGTTRESIAYEKAGIFREHQPVVCGDDDPPLTLLQAANQISAPLFCLGRDFQYQEDKTEPSFAYTAAKTVLGTSFQASDFQHLPMNTLLTQNMATVLTTVLLLQNRLPITQEAIVKGLSAVTLPGRIQIIPGRIREIHDVSHNLAAVTLLAKHLKAKTHSGKTYAVFSMLADKDIPGCVNVMKEVVDHWYVAPLTVKRAASNDKLMQAFTLAGIKAVTDCSSLAAAYAAATSKAQSPDRIVVFGSFHTVANIAQESLN